MVLQPHIPSEIIRPNSPEDGLAWVHTLKGDTVKPVENVRTVMRSSGSEYPRIGWGTYGQSHLASPPLVGREEIYDTFSPGSPLLFSARYQ